MDQGDETDLTTNWQSPSDTLRGGTLDDSGMPPAGGDDSGPPPAGGDDSSPPPEKSPSKEISHEQTEV